MNRDDVSQPVPELPAASTSQEVADAAHFQGLAKSFAIFLAVAAKEDLRKPHAADLARSSYEDLCEMLADAQGRTANREPELAETIAELQRLKEEMRELLD